MYTNAICNVHNYIILLQAASCLMILLTIPSFPINPMIQTYILKATLSSWSCALVSICFTAQFVAFSLWDFSWESLHQAGSQKGRKSIRSEFRSEMWVGLELWKESGAGRRRLVASRCPMQGWHGVRNICLPGLKTPPSSCRYHFTTVQSGPGGSKEWVMTNPPLVLEEATHIAVLRPWGVNTKNVWNNLFFKHKFLKCTLIGLRFNCTSGTALLGFY